MGKREQEREQILEQSGRKWTPEQQQAILGPGRRGAGFGGSGQRQRPRFW